MSSIGMSLPSPPHRASLLTNRIRALEKRGEALATRMTEDMASNFTNARAVARERATFTRKLTAMLIEWNDVIAVARNQRMRATALVYGIVAVFGKYDGARAAFLLITGVE